MKLVLIPQYFYPTYGGLQHFTSRLAGCIAARGVDVSILSPPAENDRDSFAELRPAQSVHWRILGRSRAEFWQMLPSALSDPSATVAFFSIEYVDLIDLQLAAIQHALLNSEKCFVRIAATGDYGDVIADHKARENVLASVAAVIVPTEYIRDEVSAASDGKVIPVVIPNLIDDSYHPVSIEDKKRLRSQLGLPDGFIGVWAGRFDMTKNLRELLEAWRRSECSGNLLLVGDDPYESRSYRKQMNKYIEAAEIENVLFFGHCTESEMPRVYQACDAYLCTSLKEGHSNASLEAASCGLPIIGYDVPGISETAVYFQHRLSALVSPGELDELAARIRHAEQSLHSPDADGRRSYHGSSTLKKHSPEVVSQAYMKGLFS